MYIFSPADVRRIEDVIRYEVNNEWEKAPTWDSRLMGVETVDGLTQTIQFNQPTVRIYKLPNQGSGMIYDPLVYREMKFEPEPVGNGLKLYRHQMDRRLTVGISMASDWATQVGEATAYYPIRGLMGLLHSGLGANPVVNSFDGLPLFSKVHPIGGGVQGTYSNEHNGLEFTAENLAAIWAYIASLRHGGDAPRNLTKDGLIVALPTSYKLRGSAVLKADWRTDVLNAQTAAVNTIKTEYGFQDPIIAPEFNEQPDHWFVGVPSGRRALNSGGVLVQQEPFSINSYSDKNEVELGRTQELEYHNRAWIGFAPGQPFYWHRITSEGAIDTYIQEILDKQ